MNFFLIQASVAVVFPGATQSVECLPAMPCSGYAMSHQPTLNAADSVPVHVAHRTLCGGITILFAKRN